MTDLTSSDESGIFRKANGNAARAGEEPIVFPKTPTLTSSVESRGEEDLSPPASAIAPANTSTTSTEQPESARDGTAARRDTDASTNDNRIDAAPKAADDTELQASLTALVALVGDMEALVQLEVPRTLRKPDISRFAESKKARPVSSDLVLGANPDAAGAIGRALDFDRVSSEIAGAPAKFEQALKKTPRFKAIEGEEGKQPWSATDWFKLGTAAASATILLGAGAYFISEAYMASHRSMEFNFDWLKLLPSGSILALSTVTTMAFTPNREGKVNLWLASATSLVAPAFIWGLVQTLDPASLGRTAADYANRISGNGAETAVWVTPSQLALFTRLCAEWILASILMLATYRLVADRRRREPNSDFSAIKRLEKRFHALKPRYYKQENAHRSLMGEYDSMCDDVGVSLLNQEKTFYSFRVKRDE